MRGNPGKGAPFLVFSLLAVMLAPSARTATTIFVDDFSGAQLDRSKWNVIVTGRTVNNEQQAYVESADTIYIAHGAEAAGASNGALVIHPRFRPGFTTPEGHAFDFISGRIDTRSKVEFTYGTAAARMKLVAGDGLWPAFWALGDGRWPDTGEIDVMENVGDAAWTSVALHGPGYFGDTPLVRRVRFAGKRDAADWHVYAVDWTRDELIFKVDDDVVYRVTRAMVERYGRWAFDNPKHLIVNLALGGTYPAAVNRISSPYPGIPESTVRLIRNDQARILVDWVRVTSPRAATQ
jgi:beta-glucanase (GH16 family)